MNYCRRSVECQFQGYESKCMCDGVCGFQVEVIPETNEIREKIFEKYQRCINQIDDYLEYRYRFDTREDVRNKILFFITSMVDELKVYAPPKVDDNEVDDIWSDPELDYEDEWRG